METLTPAENRISILHPVTIKSHCDGRVQKIDKGTRQYSSSVRTLNVACENIRFSSLFAAKTSTAAKSEEKRMFSQATLNGVINIAVYRNFAPDFGDFFYIECQPGGLNNNV